MPTFLIVILCVVGLLAALGGFVLMLAAGDPEGRTAALANWGVPMFLVGVPSFLGLGIWALVRWLA